MVCLHRAKHFGYIRVDIASQRDGEVVATASPMWDSTPIELAVQFSAWNGMQNSIFSPERGLRENSI